MQSPVISPEHWGFVLKMKSLTRAGGFKWKYSPLSEFCNDNPFQLPATTVDTVIPSSSTLVDRPPSLLPVPIDAQCQPLLSTESTSSHTGQVPIDGVGEEAVLEGQNTPFDIDSDRSRDSSRKEQVQQQQGQVIGLPA